MTRTTRDTVVAGAVPAPPTPPASVRLRVAFGLAAAGALLIAAAPLTGVVSENTEPAFTAWPLLLVLALLPPALAATFLRNHPTVAASVLAVTALFAPGRLLVDLQITVDTTYTTRPELFRPTSLTPLTPSVGLWLLVAGHLLVLAAGVTAATSSSEGEEQSGTRKFLGLVVAAGALAAIGLFMAPITSTDPLVPTGGPFDAPALAMIGGLLLAAAAPAAGVLAASNPDPEHRRGGLLAVAAALAALSLPPLVAGLTADGLGVSLGSVLVLLAALAHAVLAKVLGDTTEPAERKAVELPGLRRLHLIAGVLGLLAAAAALGGVLNAQLVVPEGLPLPVGYAERLLWPALVAVAVLSAALVADQAAARPAFAVTLAALPLAAGGALDAVFTATQIGSVEPGNGVWFTVLAVVLAIAAAVTAALAGALEREEVEPTRSRASLPLVALALIGALLVLGAFALPVLSGPDFHPVGLLDFRVGSWGLLAGLLSALAATALALRARPSRAAALLLGAALVTAVRALEHPLTSARVAGAAPGPGLWLAVAAVVALLAGAALSASRR